MRLGIETFIPKQCSIQSREKKYLTLEVQMVYEEKVIRTIFRIANKIGPPTSPEDKTCD